MGKEKSKKDKKSKKHKKEKEHKKRRKHDSSSSSSSDSGSDSDHDRKRHKSEKLVGVRSCSLRPNRQHQWGTLLLSAERHQNTADKSQAQKVIAHVQKAGGAGGDKPFVWAKKVEQELEQGKKLKEISIFSDRNRQQERLVRGRGSSDQPCGHGRRFLKGGL